MADDDLIALILDDARTRMYKSGEALRHELQGIRSGRAHPSLVEHVPVDYFGAVLPIIQLATITAPEPRLLVIQPWDRNALQPITKGLQQSDLGLNPQHDGSVIRLPLPELTEERRRDLVRQVHKITESARVATRNIRRDAQDDLRRLVKAKEISQDEEHSAHEQLEKLTHRQIEEIDQVSQEKERELMEV